MHEVHSGRSPAYIRDIVTARCSASRSVSAQHQPLTTSSHGCLRSSENGLFSTPAHAHGTNFLKISDLSRTRQLLENISRHFFTPFLINCSSLFLTFYILRDGLILSVYRRTTSMFDDDDDDDDDDDNDGIICQY